MTKIIYEIVRHDGGWAFKLGDTISETFKDHDTAYNAIQREKQMKKWRRAWKIELIESFNPDWRDLFAEIAS